MSSTDIEHYAIVVDRAEVDGVHVDSKVELAIEHRAGQETTGGIVWNAALVLRRLLERRFAGRGLSGQTVLDLGSGTGLIGMLAFALGASGVVCADVPQQLDLIAANFDRNAASLSLQRDASSWLDATSGRRIHAAQLTWGRDDDVEAARALLPGAVIDHLLCSDLLFCGIRAGCEAQLLDCIESLCQPGHTQCLFIFQERIPWEEKPWLAALRQRFATVEPVADLCLDDLRAASASDSDDDCAGIGGMFYEEPSIVCLRCIR